MVNAMADEIAYDDNTSNYVFVCVVFKSLY